jgi:cobalamin transport system substrate-binding protein
VRRAPILIAALLLVLGACGQRVPGTATSAGTRPHAPPRVVTLAPSLTEIAYAIGCQGSLVADTTFDDYPPAARQLAHVADLSDVDLERLSVVRPTIVVALHDQERETAVIWSRLRVPVVLLPNRNLSDLYIDIRGVGEACERPADAARLSRSLRAQIAAVAAKAPRTRRPRVFFLLDQPGFTAGAQSFIDDLIRLAGGINTAGTIREPYPNVSAEAIARMNPDILIVARELPRGAGLLAQEPWRSLNAVRQGRVVRPPSDDIVERNGPRVVEGLVWMQSVFEAP